MNSRKHLGVYDYVIVGAGTAGAVLASRLAEDSSVRVLLIEQGLPNRSWTTRVPGAVREAFKTGSPYMRWYKTTPQRHLDNRIIDHPRGIGVGGTSLVNGMVYVRGHPFDYAAWENDGASGWSYKDVLPYFKRVESWSGGPNLYRGGDGLVGVRRHDVLDELSSAWMRAGQEAGYPITEDVNGHQQEGFGRLDMNVDRGFRSSSSYAFIEKRGRRPNLRILPRTVCTRVVIENQTAVAVECLRDKVSERYYAEREIVLAAGAIGSPHLLQLSGIGPADAFKKIEIHPIHDLPGVGAGLQDHLELDLQWETSKGVSLNDLLTVHNVLRLGLQWLLFKTGPAASGQCKVGAFLRSGPGVTHPDVQLLMFPVCFDGWRPRTDISGFRVTAYPTRPTSRGSVRLRSASPIDDPVLDPNYLATDADMQQMMRCYEMVLQTVSQKAFDPYRRQQLDPKLRATGIREFIRMHANAGFHLCGTCKMGEDHDDMAVVNPDACVRGIARLRIADASIMPRIVSGNTAAASMMIGDRVSDLMRGRTLPKIDAPFT